MVAKAHGLKSPQPVMCSSRESVNSLYMFQSGSKYYIWNQMTDTVCEIMTSMDLVDIIAQMDKLGLVSLEVAEVPTSFWGSKRLGRAR